MRAADLVERYGADVAPHHQRVRRDINATRTRLMHGLYLSAHAVTVALHERSRDLRAAATAQGTPLPLAATGSPYLVAATAQWAHRMGACERAAGAYLGQRFPERLAHEVDGAIEATDPKRLRRALATWDIKAHRTLATHPTPANLVLVSATQARIADTAAFFLNAAPASGELATVVQAVEANKRAWFELEGRWRDLCLPHDRLEPALARSAGEVRAAYGDLIQQGTSPAVPVSVPVTSRSGLAEAVQASLEALEASGDLADVVNEKANDANLTGPARALSLRAHNDAERTRETQPRRKENRDVLWVTPRDIHTHRFVPIPRPAADGLREAARGTAQAIRSLSGALSSTERNNSTSPPGLQKTAPRPSIDAQLSSSTTVLPPAR